MFFTRFICVIFMSCALSACDLGPSSSEGDAHTFVSGDLSDLEGIDFNYAPHHLSADAVLLKYLPEVPEGFQNPQVWMGSNWRDHANFDPVALTGTTHQSCHPQNVQGVRMKAEYYYSQNEELSGLHRYFSAVRARAVGSDQYHYVASGEHLDSYAEVGGPAVAIVAVEDLVKRFGGGTTVELNISVIGLDEDGNKSIIAEPSDGHQVYVVLCD